MSEERSVMKRMHVSQKTWVVTHHERNFSEVVRTLRERYSVGLLSHNNSVPMFLVF